MRNQILKKVTVSIMLLLSINVSVADTSTSVSCAESGSASAYSRSGNSVSYSNVNCSSNNEQNAMTPAGIAVSKSYSPEPYTSLVLSGAFNTEIKTGGENKATISGDSNYVESVEVNSSNGVLIIRRPGSGNGNLNVVVESTTLQKLKISGAGSTNIYGDFSDGLSVRKSGAGRMNIGGQASTLKLNLSGAGNTTARDFTVDNVEIDATGAGNIAVCAKKSVAGSLAGAVHFKVYCNPSQRSVNTRGVSRVSYR